MAVEMTVSLSSDFSEPSAENLYELKARERLGSCGGPLLVHISCSALDSVSAHR